ncbi:MAG: DJ-1/PfpI family protein [Planctomycetes bacterium]|nr:DJ-1/PfpI family protein [Planctomycetota bacterium]
MKRLALVLAPGFEEIEAASFVSIFGWTRAIEGLEPIFVDPVATEREVSGANGLLVRITNRIGEIEPSHYAGAAVPGGAFEKGYSHATDTPVLDFLRAIDNKGGFLSSTGTGSRALAAAGILVGRRATTFPFADGRHRAFLHECGATVTDGPVEHDATIITGNSPWVARDTALELLSALAGDRAVAAVKRSMGSK